MKYFIHFYFRRKSALPKYDPPYTKRQMLKGYSHPNSPHPSQHLTPDHTFDDAGKLGQGLGGFPPYRPVEYVLFCLSFAVLSVAILSVAVFSIAILSGHLVMWSSGIIQFHEKKIYYWIFTDVVEILYLLPVRWNSHPAWGVIMACNIWSPSGHQVAGPTFPGMGLTPC